MRKKIITIGLVYISLILLITLFNSCFLRENVSICEVEFRGKRSSTSITPPDTLINHIAFTISAHSELQTCNIWNSLNPISSCYATTKGIKWLNDLDVSTFKLSLDTALIMQNNVISADSNLLSNPTIKLFSTITKDTFSYRSVDYDIDFQDTLKTMFNFEERLYTVRFSCRTTDGREIAQKAQIVFK